MHPKNRRNRRSERGAAMIMAICITMVIIAIGIAMLSMSTSELKATKAQGDTIALRNLAESGVERAMARLNKEPTWRCTDKTDAVYNNAQIVGKVDNVDTVLGTYTVDAVKELPGDYVQVTARGYYPSADDPNARSKQVRLTAYKCWGTPFSAAAFGRDGVPLANGSTDSYNSGAGSYHAQTPGHKGDIRTDSTDPNSITIFKNGMCNGRVMYGPGTDLTKVGLDPTRINTGVVNDPEKIVAAPAAAVMPPVTAPSSATPISDIDNGSNILNRSLTLTAGTWVCDGISISGQTTVRTTGAVILYVRGDISITGNGIVNNGDTTGGVALPSNLLIYGTSACLKAAISGNGYLSAAVYTPSADIVLNGAGTNGEVFGALAGKTVSFNGNGTVLHYDEALQSLKGVVIGFRTKHWEEDY